MEHTEPRPTAPILTVCCQLHPKPHDPHHPFPPTAHPPSVSLIERYIAAWREHDVAGILDTLTRDCLVIESFGPVYRGHHWIEQWVPTWCGEGGRVIAWTIRDLRCFPDIEVAEWHFHYSWRGEEQRFDGSTIARLRDGKIAYLREYATTADLYDWQGRFR